MILKEGSSGSEVKALQMRLNQLGFGPLIVDGEFGPGTTASVRRYQSKYGLPVDGIVGPVTAGKLGLAGATDDPNWPKGLDAAVSLADAASCLKAGGFSFVARYYNANDPGKNLTKAEAQALSDAGVSVVSVWENGYPTEAKYFDLAKGIYDGEGAAKIAQEVGQPAGTPIYFAVDFDAAESDLPTIDAYFTGVAQGVANILGGGEYGIGVYGSGQTCAYVLAHNPHVAHSWLAGATGWAGYDSFGASRRWNLRQGGWGNICGASVDLDVSQGNGGGWSFE